MLFTRLLLSSFLAVSTLIPFASAHGDTLSLEKEVDGYLVDVGYTPALEEGKEITFSFDLYTGSGVDVDFASFDMVTLTVVKNEELLFQQAVVNVPPDVPWIAYTFPEKGSYKLMVSYSRGAEQKVDTTFDVRIGSEDSVVATLDSDKGHYFFTGLLVLVLLVAIVVMIRQRRSPGSAPSVVTPIPTPAPAAPIATAEVAPPVATTPKRKTAARPRKPRAK